MCPWRAPTHPSVGSEALSTLLAVEPSIGKRPRSAESLSSSMTSTTLTDWMNAAKSMWPRSSTSVEPRYGVFGDAAVVTYGRLQQRGRATTRTEETRVWRRCDPGSDAALGRWRLVHFHRSAPSNAYG